MRGAIPATPAGAPAASAGTAACSSPAAASLPLLRALLRRLLAAAAAATEAPPGVLAATNIASSRLSTAALDGRPSGACALRHMGHEGELHSEGGEDGEEEKDGGQVARQQELLLSKQEDECRTQARTAAAAGWVLGTTGGLTMCRPNQRQRDNPARPHAPAVNDELPQLGRAQRAVGRRHVRPLAHHGHLEAHHLQAQGREGRGAQLGKGQGTQG